MKLKKNNVYGNVGSLRGTYLKQIRNIQVINRDAFYTLFDMSCDMFLTWLLMHFLTWFWHALWQALRKGFKYALWHALWCSFDMPLDILFGMPFYMSFDTLIYNTFQLFLPPDIESFMCYFIWQFQLLLRHFTLFYFQNHGNPFYNWCLRQNRRCSGKIWRYVL